MPSLLEYRFIVLNARTADSGWTFEFFRQRLLPSAYDDLIAAAAATLKGFSTLFVSGNRFIVDRHDDVARLQTGSGSVSLRVE